MRPPAEPETIWRDIAVVLNDLPPDARHRYREAIRQWTHDLGHHVGLITTSVGLLRRESQANPQAAVDEELLGIIEEAGRALRELLAQLRQLPETLDDPFAQG